MMGAKVMTLCFAVFACFAPQLVPRIFGFMLSQKLVKNFPYELKAKLAPMGEPAR